MSSIIKKLGKKKKPGRVEFLENKSDIEEAISGGWTAKDVWSQLVDDQKITLSYQMFMRHYRHFCKDDTSDDANKHEFIKEDKPTPRTTNMEDKKPIKTVEDIRSNGPIKVGSKKQNPFVVSVDPTADDDDSSLY